MNFHPTQNPSRNLAAELLPPSASKAEYLTPAELRARWKVSGMFLWRLRRDGKLKITKFGSRGVRIAMSEIERIEKEAQA